LIRKRNEVNKANLVYQGHRCRVVYGFRATLSPKKIFEKHVAIFYFLQHFFFTKFSPKSMRRSSNKEEHEENRVG
jgi:hypothetical protein